jgi:hypothetical protein
MEAWKTNARSCCATNFNEDTRTPSLARQSRSLGTITQFGESRSPTISFQGRLPQEEVVLWNHLIASKGDGWQSLP